MRLTVLYFAWIRERVGTAREDIETAAATVTDLIAELRARDSAHEAAFADVARIRVAVDQRLTNIEASLKNANEVAFFPPMTGG